MSIYNKFLEAARDHYWDSLEPEREIVIKHIEGIIAHLESPAKERPVRPAKSIREENLARLTKQSKPLNIEELLSLLSVAKEQDGNLAIYIDGEPLTERHIRIVHLLDRSVEKRLASAGLAELFGYDPDQPDVCLEINHAVSRL